MISTKQINKKIPAFTLMEVVVVMAISAGVVGLSYWSYEVFSRQFENYRTRSEENLQMAALNQALSQDFTAARFIRRIPEGATCIKADSSTISYEFYQAVILRKASGVTDTFHMQPLEVKMQFNGQSVPAGRLIDELNLRVVLQKENHYLQYLKTYGADVLMQEDEKGHNSDDY